MLNLNWRVKLLRICRHVYVILLRNSSSKSSFYIKEILGPSLRKLKGVNQSRLGNILNQNVCIVLSINFDSWY